MRVIYGLLLTAGFGFAAANGIFGREFFGAGKRMELPPSVRQTPGGYRTFLHNNGFRGGK
jgi:hypothetical protein